MSERRERRGEGDAEIRRADERREASHGSLDRASPRIAVLRVGHLAGGRVNRRLDRAGIAFEEIDLDAGRRREDVTVACPLLTRGSAHGDKV